ncbi:hypothetical protein T439DRAFT_320800 [Meredithblackwellia eburnea MCA 4105]
MKSLTFGILIFLLGWTVSALPSRPFMQLQPDGSHKLVINPDRDWSPATENAQQEFTIQQDSTHFNYQEEGDEEEGASTWPPKRKGPFVIDLSQYTILEILNISLHRPHPPPPPPSSSVWPPPSKPEQLPIHKFAWLVNRSSEAQAALDGDGITLLAPDDWALTPPRRRRKNLATVLDEGDEMREWMRMEMEEREHQPVPHPFYSKHISGSKCTAHEEPERFGDAMDEEEGPSSNRTKLISKIIGWVTQYHLLPDVYSHFSLLNHSTLPTLLGQNGPKTEPFRIHIDPGWDLVPIPHPSVKFNFYAHKREVSVKAKNGLIHFLSAPLLPPLSPLNKLFLFPQAFGTLTSDLQKVHLSGALLPPGHGFEEDDDGGLMGLWSEGSLDELGGEMGMKEKGPYTLFAPSNGAFNKLGFKLVAFLHSPLPIASKILKYVLAYHVVPDLAFFSDYIWNSTASAQVEQYKTEEMEIDLDEYEWTESVLEDDEPEMMERDGLPLPNLPKPKLPDMPSKPPSHPPPPPHHRPHKFNVSKYHLPTLLVTSGVNPNATLEVHVVSFRGGFGRGPLKRVVLVIPSAHAHGEESGHHSKGRGRKPVRVWLKDVPARNGAVQVVGEILRPPVPHHNSSFWPTSVEGKDERRMRKWLGKKLFA